MAGRLKREEQDVHVNRLRLQRVAAVEAVVLDEVMVRLVQALDARVFNSSHANGIISRSPQARNGVVSCQLCLDHGTTPIAKLHITGQVREGKLEAAIETMQGVSRGPGHSNSFKQANDGRPWNQVLGRAFVDAAYETGFDRALLRDITTTLDYHSPCYSTFESGFCRNITQTRRQMRDLYHFVRRDCDFHGIEWRGKTRYWTREFP